LEKKNENLLRENEKLRNDSRVTRRSINLVDKTLNSNSILSGVSGNLNNTNNNALNSSMLNNSNNKS
jgi:hypothetical protein